MRSRHHSTSSSRELRRRRRCPACSSTTATTISPHSSSGTPTTPTSPTAGMAEQHGLDLGRIDVDAAADDQVGAAVGEEQVAVVVDVADVAEREVVAPVGARRSSRAPCSTRSGWPPAPSGRRCRSCPARPRLPSSSRIRTWSGGFTLPTVPGFVSHSVGADERARALGRGVVLAHDRAEPLDQPLLHVDRTRRGAVDDVDRATRRRTAPSPRRAATAAGGTSSAPCACA